MIEMTTYQKSIESFCRQWDVKELSLFGSAAHGDLRPDSDVDVLVDLSQEQPYSLFDLVAMIRDLEDIFGRKVDLVEKTSIRNPFRRASIMKHRKLIYVA